MASRSTSSSSLSYSEDGESSDEEYAASELSLHELYKCRVLCNEQECYKWLVANRMIDPPRTCAKCRAEDAVQMVDDDDPDIADDNDCYFQCQNCAALLSTFNFRSLFAVLDGDFTSLLPYHMMVAVIFYWSEGGNCADKIAERLGLSWQNGAACVRNILERLRDICGTKVSGSNAASLGGENPVELGIRQIHSGTDRARYIIGGIERRTNIAFLDLLEGNPEPEVTAVVQDNVVPESFILTTSDDCFGCLERLGYRTQEHPLPCSSLNVEASNGKSPTRTTNRVSSEGSACAAIKEISYHVVASSSRRTDSARVGSCDELLTRVVQWVADIHDDQEVRGTLRELVWRQNYGGNCVTTFAAVLDLLRDIRLILRDDDADDNESNLRDDGAEDIETNQKAPVIYSLTDSHISEAASAANVI